MQGQRNRGRTALTIPFFIGSLHSPTHGALQPRTAKDEIHALFSSFLDDVPMDHAVSIYRCPDIKQPVAIEFYSQYFQSGAVGLQSQSQKRTTLYVSSEFTSDGIYSLTSLSEQLFQELQQPICNGRFSFRHGVYTAFSDEDLKFIETSKRL